MCFSEVNLFSKLIIKLIIEKEKERERVVKHFLVFTTQSLINKVSSHKMLQRIGLGLYFKNKILSLKRARLFAMVIANDRNSKRCLLTTRKFSNPCMGNRGKIHEIHNYVPGK